MKRFEKIINYLLKLKYQTNESIFYKIITDNIIFNEKCHLVSKYKEFLILEDEYEFFKRYYTKQESTRRIKKFINYYNKNSFLFPNYSPLSEAQIIYKNINSKQKIIEDMKNSNKKYDNKKKNKEEKDDLDSIVFNSKVYDSIINNSENCLSIFSNDKESTINEIKDEEIIELINSFDKFDLNLKNNKKDISKIKIALKSNTNHKNKNLNNNNIINDDNNKIYTRKKTPNHSINSNKAKNLKTQSKCETEERNQIENNSNNESRNFLMENQKKGIYKKIKLNLIDFSGQKFHRSIGSYKVFSGDNSLITTISRNKTNNNIPLYINDLKEEINEKDSNLLNKTNDLPIKTRLLTEQLTRIKVNTTNLGTKRNTFKNENKDKENYKDKDRERNFKKDKPKLIINVNKINTYTHRKKINSNSFNSRNREKINYLTERKINNFTENNEIPKTIYNLSNSNEEINVNKRNNYNSFRENKINLIKNKKEYAQQFNYIINNYNCKTTNYNTSIKINNNINIQANNHNNNFLRNIYDTTPFSQSNNNTSDFVNKTPYEKKIISERRTHNALKKNKYFNNYLLNNNYSSSSSNNANKRKKFISNDNFTSIDKSNNYLENSSSKQGTLINIPNYEIITTTTTPFDMREKDKIFYRMNTTTSNDTIDTKISTISDIYKNKSKLKRREYDKLNDNQISNLINKKLKFLNMTNTSINITKDKNHSFLTSKEENNKNNIFQNYCRNINGRNNINIGKAKKSKNNTFVQNSYNINDEIIKKLDKNKNIEKILEYNEKKRKKILNESNEQINQYHLNFLKKFYHLKYKRIRKITKYILK